MEIQDQDDEVSVSEADIAGFEKLLMDVCERMKIKAASDPNHFIGMSSDDFEIEVERTMAKAAIGTPFHEKVVRHSGKKFPDIAVLPFGVEVKKVESNHWTSLGNSVNEGSRIEGVRRIYVVFGKLCKPVEFKFRLYEKCLREISVTHWPRYQIDMETPEGESIFDKMEIGYETLSTMEKAVIPIRKYYKGLLREGEYVWWLDTGEEETGAVSPIIKTKLDTNEKKEIRMEGLARFPQLLKDDCDRDKYNQPVVWFLEKRGFVDPHMRDTFSGGGQRLVDGELVPRIVYHLSENVEPIINLLKSENPEILEETWKVTVTGKDPVEVWIALMKKNAMENEYIRESGFDIEAMIRRRLPRGYQTTMMDHEA